MSDLTNWQVVALVVTAPFWGPFAIFTAVLVASVALSVVILSVILLKEILMAPLRWARGWR